MKNASIDVSRLIRIATVLVAIFAGTIVYFQYQPRIETLRFRIEDAESALRSEEVAIHEMPHLRQERDALAMRYARLMTGNAQACFLKELMSIARTQALTLVATSLSTSGSAQLTAPHPGLLSQTHATLELRGSYRHLLVAISKLSTGSEIVSVEAPSFHRDNVAIIASVPITLYEPTVQGGSFP